MSKLNYSKLQMRFYLKSKTLSYRQQILLFKFRCRMINVGRNFGRHSKCPICLIEDDSQEHLFNCTKLDNRSSHKDYEYDDIFSNDTKKLEKILNQGDIILRKREEILNSNWLFSL